jgi:fluoride exporter
MIWAAVFLAGAAGAVCRFVVDGLVSSRSRGPYPWGTTVVNLSGALLIGVISGLVARANASGAIATIGAAGFCGAYTTFSTLVVEALRLVEDRAYAAAAAHLGSVALGGVFAAGGWALTLV